MVYIHILRACTGIWCLFAFASRCSGHLHGMLLSGGVGGGSGSGEAKTEGKKCTNLHVGIFWQTVYIHSSVTNRVGGVGVSNIYIHTIGEYRDMYVNVCYIQSTELSTWYMYWTLQ